MEDVTLAELRERLDDDALTVLDVRNPLEFEGRGRRALRSRGKGTSRAQ